MRTKLFLETPAIFSFRHTVYSHGWSELLPLQLDDKHWRLACVLDSGSAKPISAVIYESDGGLSIEVSGKKLNEQKLFADVRHMLRLDDPLEEFYRLTDNEERLSWVSVSKAGRLIRSATVFEDMVKTMCTTNCSWALTKNMVRNLVNNLGEPAIGGGRAFPTPQAMASVSEKFYRDEIRAGYRSPYFLELAKAVVSGRVNPESWLTSDLPTAELKKEIKNVKGFGDYAADNLLKLIGRYDGLALDSWLRSQFYKKHNREKVCPDKKIQRHYTKFGEWRGLAMWCDMTERWFDDNLLN
ncbi:MAG: Fe-S cluster assembly protein HesB [Acidobacteriota bacterium]